MKTVVKHLSKIFVLLFVVLLSFSSCGNDEPDGKWAPMKWTNVNNLMNINGDYFLPEVGGTYTFLCRNYDHPWIASVTVDGVQQMLDNENKLEYNAQWCSVKFEGNKLIIEAQPLPASVDSRNIRLEVTAGDIFDHLVFVQKKDVYN